MPNFPVALDPKLIARDTLRAYSLSSWGNLDNFEDAALDWLASKDDLGWQKRRHLLQRLSRPDIADLPKLVVADLESKDFFSSGSIFEVAANLEHPVMAGMPARSRIFFDRGPVFEALEEFKGIALAEYAPTGSPLLSGYLLGEKHLQGKAAALDVFHGKGHVLLIGFRPQWRGQPFGTFRIFFNSVLYAGEVGTETIDN